MISASKEFKEKLKSGANLVNYADITLSDGTVLNLTYKDFMIGGCQIEDKTTDGKFGVGFAVGKTLSIRLENKDERFSQYDFYKSIINLYVAMQLDDGSIEKIRKGVFYTVVPETPGDIIEISAVDGMYQLDKDYSTSATAYPATLQKIISDACLDCGIAIGFKQFDNMNFTVYEKPEKATYRQVVSYACQIAGYNAHIDNNGYMQLVWYDSALLEQYNYVGGDFRTYPHDTVIDGGNFTDYSTDTIISGGNFTDGIPEHIFRIKSLNVSTDDVQITGVRVIGEDKKEALFGEEGYVIEVSGNPFSNLKEQDVADYLGKRIVGIVFRPFSASILGNPLYEPFEVVRVSDRKGNVYNSVINSVSYKIGGYTQVACLAEDPVRNGSRYVSPAAQAVVEARRNTEKQLTTYDKAVQNMNQIAMNAMGYHTTYEDQPDGSRITYLHDKPTLEESRTIYKQTIDGFFISTDGGKSYTAGFDKNGNAVVNILYAIGIVADWIRGGTLTLGGNNNVHGNMTVMDESGNAIVKIDKDGIYIHDSVLNFEIDGSSISNSIRLTAVIEGKKYVANINATGVGIIGYSLTNGEWVEDYSSTQSGNTISLKDKKGNTTYILPNSLMLNGTAYFNNNRLNVGNSYLNYTGFLSLLNDNVLVNKDGLSIGKTINTISYYLSDSMHCRGRGTFDGSISVSAGASVFKGGVTITGQTIINGTLSVTSTKNRKVETKNYSDRLLYCYEMAKPYFGDIGEATLDENGICYIFIDDVLLEAINTDCQYQVFLQKYGEGDIWIRERKNNYFIVAGTPNLRFAWELKARQRGYEAERLELFMSGESEVAIDYEKEAQKYIDNYYEEVLYGEKSN